MDGRADDATTCLNTSPVKTSLPRDLRIVTSQGVGVVGAHSPFTLGRWVAKSSAEEIGKAISFFGSVLGSPG